MPTQTNGILSKQVKANWRGAFENEMRKAEKAIIGSVRRFYQSEYEKGVDAFLQQGTIKRKGYSQQKDLKKYIKICMCKLECGLLIGMQGTLTNF